jgi:hypothetical protein
MGHSVWLDEELSGGQTWWDQILEEVRSSDLFVFILEQAALESTACQREIVYASDLGKPILPLLVSDDVSTNLLPPALTEIQYVDYRTPDREAAFRLARAITATPAPGPLPDPLPEPPDVPLSYLGGLVQKIETSATLTYEEQSALLIDLKRGLRTPETESDARRLLLKLRNRRDLLASIAYEIDDATRRESEVSRPERAPEEPSGGEPSSEEPVGQEAPSDEPARDEAQPSRLSTPTPPILPVAKTPGVIAREPQENTSAGPRGRTPRVGVSKPLVMVLQVVAGAGLVYARPDLKRRWVYVVGAAFVFLALVLDTWDLDYELTGNEIFYYEAAWMGSIGLIVYLIGLGDALFNVVLKKSS